MFFTLDERPKVLHEFPGVKFVELGTILGERWRSLPEKDRKKYHEQAAEDKVRFTHEMQQYQANKVVFMAPPMDTSAQHEIYIPNMDHLQFDPSGYHHQMYDQSSYHYE